MARSTPRRGANRPEPRPSRVPVVLGMVLMGVVAVGIGLGWYALRGSATIPPATGPNVVLIVLDDVDLGTWEQTPALQALLPGRVFTNAYTTDTSSSASRMSMLTGQYAHNHGVLSDVEPIGGFGRSVRNAVQHRSIQVALHDAGYRTGYVGEYLAGYGVPSIMTAGDVSTTYVPPDWDRWYALAGVPAYTGYTVNADGTLVHPTGYLTNDLADQAVAFMTDATTPASYFLVLAPLTARMPAEPAPADAKTKFTVKAPTREEDVSDKPGFLRGLKIETRKEVRQAMTDRLRAMQSVTALVQRVVSAMDDNTYLIITSDRGFSMGQNALPMGAGAPYEPDLRVPMVVVGPDVNQSLDGRLALNIDVAPTIADATGVTLEDPPDGVSLLAPPSAGDRQDFLVEHEEAGPIPRYVAVHTTKSLYVEWSRGDVELYHLGSDPTEDKNLAVTKHVDEQYGEELTRLATRLQVLLTCAGVSCQGP